METKLVLGIDIDEVVANQLEQVIKFYSIKTGKLYSFKDFFSYNWWDVWKISKEEAINIDREFKNSSYFEDISLVEGAKQAIFSLSDRYEVIFITSRPLSVKEKTEEFIKKNFYPKKFKVFFSGDFHKENRTKTKAEICKELNVSFLIEDGLDYSVESAKKGIVVFLIDKPWNKKAIHQNITRVKNWEEVLKKLK
jgi:uncharacterized HAD superfamily protein